ncbi:hypothetical protein LCGC14_2880830, partial [marine sediment metagenome]
SAVIVERTPDQLAGPTLVEREELNATISYTDKLKEAQEATFRLSIDTLLDDTKEAMRDLSARPLEVWVYRDSQMVFAGPIVGGEVRNRTITLSCRGLEFYTAYMLLDKDTTWASVDLATITKDVIDDWQDRDYGDYGIDTVSVGTIGTTRSLTWPGVYEPIDVYSFLREQAETDFDWWVDSSTRELNVSASRGSDLTDSVFIERGITEPEMRIAVSPGAVASHVYLIGTGPNLSNPLTSTATTTALRNSFGLSGMARVADLVENQVHLDSLSAEVASTRAKRLFLPGPNVLSIDAGSVDAFGIGDTVTYTLDVGLGQITGAFRITSRTVNVGNRGQETMTMQVDDA